MSNHSTSAFVALVLASIIASTSTAENYYDETDLLTDIPMVSAGSRMAQARYESPSSVTVITSDMIKALAPNNLVEVFRLAPGFMSFYVNGSFHALSGHDLTDDDPRRLEVRVNGRSVYVPSYPTISWQSLGITPDDIQRIELVRGSNVPAYGSNAIIGAIEIITKSPLQESGTHIRMTAGDLETRNFNVRSNFDMANGYGQIRLSHRENNGFDRSNGIDGLGRPDNTPSIGDLEDNTSVNHIVFNSVITPTLIDTFTFEVGFSKGSFGLGDTDRVDEIEDDDNSSYWLATGWSRVEEKQQWKWDFSLYDSRSENSIKELLSVHENLDPATLNFILQGNPDVVLEWALGKRDAQMWETEFEYQYTFNDRLRVLSGVSYKLQRLKSEHLLDSDEVIDNGIASLFSNIEWHISSKWMTNIGFMVEDQEIDETHMSPRASLHYQLRPQHNFRISASKAYRSPSIVEKHREEVKRAYNVLADYYRLTDDSLKAEEMESVELAYYGSFFDGKVEIDWRTFHEDMNGGIDHVKWEVAHQNWSPSAIDDKVYFFTNSKHWRATGYDMQITWRPFSSTAIYLQHANVRVDAIRFTDWDDTVGEQRILKVPEHTSSLLISQKFGSGWSGSIMGYHQSYVDWRGGEEIKALDRYDLSVSKEVRLNQYQLRLDLKVDNVTNEVYLEYQKGNYLERTVYLSAALEW